LAADLDARAERSLLRLKPIPAANAGFRTRPSPSHNDITRARDGHERG
jgi:hypothetical protein